MSTASFHPFGDAQVTSYPATIRLIHPDGSADLDVQVPDGPAIPLVAVPGGTGEPGTWSRGAPATPAPVVAIAPMPAQPSLLTTILAAVDAHPLAVSQMLLDVWLRGDPLERLVQKGLTASPFFGILRATPATEVRDAIAAAVTRRLLHAASGAYPGLSLTAAGYTVMSTTASTVVSDVAYQAYYRWRQGVARTLGKPPYRVMPNEIVVQLARVSPTTLEVLLTVKGLGKQRALRYQHDLLAIGQQLHAPPAAARS